MGPKAMVTTGSIFQILAKPHKQKFNRKIRGQHFRECNFF